MCGWDRGEPCEDCMRLLFRNIYTGSYCLESYLWRHVSREAKDLIRKLLVTDAKQRISAVDILEHPWFSKYKDNKATNETDGSTKTVSDEGADKVANILQLSSPEESRMIKRRKMKGRQCLNSRI